MIKGLEECANEVEFSTEQLEKIDKILETEWFKELNSEVLICNLDDEKNEIIKQIKRYILMYIKEYDFSDEYVEKFGEWADSFLEFMDKYSKKEKPQFRKENNGIINISGNMLHCGNGYTIDQKTRRYADKRCNGQYIKGTLIDTEGKKYIAKAPMNSRELSVGKNAIQEVLYNSIIAQHTFEYFDTPTAEYMVVKHTPFKAILSKNFLRENQELIELRDLYKTSEETYTYSTRIHIIEENIRMRYENQLSKYDMENLIKKLKLQYCKQELVKRLIGPMDANTTNTAIILTTDGNEAVPQIDVSPAYDLDLSFWTSEALYTRDMLDVIQCDNGKSDLKSIISEFKEADGFSEELKKIIDKIKQNNPCKEIVEETYKKTRY